MPNDTYTYVIAGAGAAGCALANRLSAETCGLPGCIGPTVIDEEVRAPDVVWLCCMAR
jgi:hypothetical protein